MIKLKPILTILTNLCVLSIFNQVPVVGGGEGDLGLLLVGLAVHLPAPTLEPCIATTIVTPVFLLFFFQMAVGGHGGIILQYLK